MKKIFLIISINFLLFQGIVFAGVKYKTVIDAEGRKVEISQKIERVIALTAVCLDVIYISGAIDKVVGVSKAVFFKNPVYGEIIKELKDIPIVAPTEQDVNIEKLLSLKPDLVIGFGGTHPYALSRELIERIEGFGIPVVLIDAKSLEENYYAINLLGKIFNQKEKTDELIRYMKKVVKKVEKETQKIPEEKKVKVMTVSGDNPTYVAGNYWGKQDIRILAGGKMIPDDIKQFFTVISLEKIISLNPDVILVSHTAKYSPEDILQNPQFKDVKAVQNKRVYKNPYQIGGLFTPRVVLILSWTAKKLYPEIDIDWVKIADEFFRKFYGISYYGPKE